MHQAAEPLSITLKIHKSHAQALFPVYHAQALFPVYHAQALFPVFHQIYVSHMEGD